MVTRSTAFASDFLMVIGSAAVAQAGKKGSSGAADVEICHKGEPLWVNGNAVGGHEGHGDWVVEAEICGDGIDNDCDGLVDSDDDDCSCPCFTVQDIIADYDQSGASSATCYEDTYYWYYGHNAWIEYYGASGGGGTGRPNGTTARRSATRTTRTRTCGSTLRPTRTSRASTRSKRRLRLSALI